MHLINIWSYSTPFELYHRVLEDSTDYKYYITIMSPKDKKILSPAEHNL